MRVKHVFLSAVIAAALAFVVFYRPADPTQHGAKTVIQVWQPFGGPWYEGVQTMVKGFEKSNPDMACSVVFMGNHVYRDMKFYMSVVGNCPPDVVFVPSNRVVEWAHRRLLAPLDDLLKDAGRDPKAFREEFFEPLWRECTYYDHMYAVPLEANPVWGMIWNKRKLREAIATGDIPAGAIDPEKPPQTVADLDRFDNAVTKFENNDRVGGRLLRVGVVPYSNWMYSDALYPWGWVFGGEFYNEKTGKITANDPHVVKALEWFCAVRGHATFRRSRPCPRQAAKTGSSRART